MADNKFLDNNGVIYLWSKIKTYVADHSGGGAADSVDWENVQNKPDLALKSDISSVYDYKGSVLNYAALPAEGTEGLKVGDVYNVEETDMNYAWTGTTWDPLGTTFTINPITNEEIDAIVADTTTGG